MTSELEYDECVRRSIPASVALFSLFALSLLLVSSSYAQINGAPASVTSPGFGGNAINGPRASVTSLGPRGYAPGPGVGFSTGIPFDGRRGDDRRGDGERGHHHHGSDVPPVFYAFPVPYAVDLGAAAEEDNAETDADEQDSNYQGGPTVFDRRGSGRETYVPPARTTPAPHSADRRDDAAAPTAPEALEPTMLVFKDGHKLEVGNYAIIGQTLFDMTPGHARKVPLADLDLEATRRQNDDRGITFQLPISSKVN
jgi:hypothetical protein